jgi:hypothetical protein
VLQAKLEAGQRNAEYWDAECQKARREAESARNEQPAFFRYGLAWGAVLATAAVTLMVAIAWRWR